MTLYSPPYTSPFAPYGNPFNSGGAPGLSAPLFDQLEGFLYQIDQPNATVLNGATSGTATLYQPFTGIYKLVLVNINNFRNGGGSNQQIAIPTPFTSVVMFESGDVPGMSLLRSGSAQNIAVITGLASGGGSTSVVTTVGGYSFGECGGGIDTIQFNSGGASSHSGLLILKGI